MRKGNVKFQSQSFFSFEPIFEALIALEVFLCSEIFLGEWLSFEPISEALIALEVPERAYRSPFPDLSPSRDRRFDLAGSAFDFGTLSASDGHRSFASVLKMTTEDPNRREKQKIGRSGSKRAV